MRNRFTYFHISHWVSIAIGIGLILLSGYALAADLLEFDNPEQKSRFYAMIEQTRCLVCQNQSLADSDAPLANDLRKEILQQMQTGKTDAEIRDFLVDRYSEFVLYSPPLSAATFILWFGPLLFVLIGIWVIFRFIRQQKNTADHTDTSKEAS